MRDPRREHRRAKRLLKRQAAWISHGAGRSDVPCVLWDMSETGARLSAARSNFLPAGFKLLLTKDRRSQRYCRVVWRTDGQLGVQFIQGDNDDDDFAPRARRPRSTSSGSVAAAPAPVAAHEIEAARSQLMVPLRRAASAASVARGERRSFAFSTMALSLLILLGGATVMFYAAGVQAGADAPWALQVCDHARSFCEHPEFSGAAGAKMMVVWLAVKGMEL
jgi:hypothetical protein